MPNSARSAANGSKASRSPSFTRKIGAPSGVSAKWAPSRRNTLCAKLKCVLRSAVASPGGAVSHPFAGALICPSARIDTRRKPIRRRLIWRKGLAVGKRTVAPAAEIDDLFPRLLAPVPKDAAKGAALALEVAEHRRPAPHLRRRLRLDLRDGATEARYFGAQISGEGGHPILPKQASGERADGRSRSKACSSRRRAGAEPAFTNT